jgi:hypothetical protein
MLDALAPDPLLSQGHQGRLCQHQRNAKTKGIEKTAWFLSTIFINAQKTATALTSIPGDVVGW